MTTVPKSEAKVSWLWAVPYCAAHLQTDASGEKLQTYFQYRLTYCAVCVRKMPGHNSVIFQLHFCAMGKSSKHHIQFNLTDEDVRYAWVCKKSPPQHLFLDCTCFFPLSQLCIITYLLNPGEAVSLCLLYLYRVLRCCDSLSGSLKSSLNTWPQCLGCFRTTNWKRFQVSLWSCCLPSFSSCSSSAKRRSSGL